MNKLHRVVCICRGGQVRSAAARRILADVFGFRKVLVCGFEKNDEETVAMLCEWADVVLVVGRGSEWNLPTPPNKTVHLEIGPDVWGNCWHPDLIGKLTTLIRPLVEA